MNRNLLYSLFLILFVSTVVYGQGGIIRSDEPYNSVLATGNGNNPPAPIPLRNITDTLSNYMVGQSAIHQVGFQLPHFDDQPVGLLRGRQVVITFPPEFDVSTVRSIAYSDTDDGSANPKIESLYLFAHSVVIRFKDKIPSPEETHFAYIIIRSMYNPTQGGDYRVMVQLDNRLGQTIAGPGYSEPFTIIAQEAQSLTITPTNDTTLQAGQSIEFEATAIDHFGNPIEPEEIEWYIDPDFDPIGHMDGSIFRATTIGQGRVVARIDTLEAFSGLITVLHGEFAALGIELDETQFVGHLFRGEALVIAYDEYGNPVTDFNESGNDLYLSSSTGTISPEVLPASQFVGGGAVLWSHEYSGEPGRVSLTVSNNEGIEASTEFYANGLHAVFRSGSRVPEWLLTGWSFLALGLLGNPANLTPIEISYDAGFIESDAPPPSLGPLGDCIPLPLNEKYCPFGLIQTAYMTPGIYQYFVTVVAAYELESETLTTVWTHNTEIPVDPFTPFTYEALDLPSTGFAEDYIDSGSVLLSNSNVYDLPIFVYSYLYMENEQATITLAETNYTFEWESEKVIDLTLVFRSDFAPDTYSYQMRSRYSIRPESRLWYIFRESDDFPLDAEIEIVAPVQNAVQIISLKNNAFNAPFVNTGQEFNISGTIANHSSVDLEGPFILELITDGQSSVPPPLVLDLIPAADTPMVVSFVVTAGGESNPAEVFTLNITGAPGNIQVLPAISNHAPAVIQTPASLRAMAEIAYHPGPVASLGFGQPFKITGGSINTGQALVDGGTMVLDYEGPGDFGMGFPDEQPLEPAASWDLTAPYEEMASSFIVSFGSLPIDRNTGNPAIISDTLVVIDFEIVAPETKLIVEAGGFDTRPLVRGVFGKLFELSLQNSTTDIRNLVAVEYLLIEVLDRDGRPITPESLIDESPDGGANFYLNGKPVAERNLLTDDLAYSFPGLTIRPGEVITLEYMLKPKGNTSFDYFNMRLESDDIIARISDGPDVGQRVPVTGLLDRIFDISIPQSIIPVEFAASFKNYPNPFNPTVKPTEFRYNLPGDSDVDIYIYTATGEEVRHLHFNAGSNGGQTGVNTGIYWDGYNGNGDMVLNGVYVAYIEVAAIGLTAKVKMAVVK